MHKNHISTSLNDFLNEIEFKKNHPHTPVGLPSGLRIFDTYTNGFQKGDLILIIYALLGYSILNPTLGYQLIVSLTIASLP